MIKSKNAIQIATTDDLEKAIRLEYRIGKTGWSKNDYHSNKYLARRITPDEDAFYLAQYGENRPKWKGRSEFPYTISSSTPDGVGDLIVQEYTEYLWKSAQLQIKKLMPLQITNNILETFPFANTVQINDLIEKNKRDLAKTLAEYSPLHLIIASEQGERIISNPDIEYDWLSTDFKLYGLTDEDFRKAYAPILKDAQGIDKKQFNQEQRRE